MMIMSDCDEDLKAFKRKDLWYDFADGFVSLLQSIMNITDAVNISLYPRLE